MGANAVRFHAGSVSAVRCHAVLGSYSLSILYAFGFHRSPTTLRPGCPGARVRTALGRAVEVRSDTGGGHEVLTFLDDQGHDVLTLRARG